MDPLRFTFKSADQSRSRWWTRRTWPFVALFPVGAGCLLQQPSLAVGVVGLVLVALAYTYDGSHVDEESLVVLPDTGVQLEARFRSGKVSRRFVPMSDIEAAIINEGFKRCRVVFYLALVLRPTTIGNSQEPATEAEGGSLKVPRAKGRSSSSVAAGAAAAAAAAAEARGPHGGQGEGAGSEGKGDPAKAADPCLVVAFEHGLPRLPFLKRVYAALDEVVCPNR